MGLFTRCSHPSSLASGLRRQIRNRVPIPQEKIRILFSFSVQKNLDEKRFSGGPIFSLVSDAANGFKFVRQRSVGPFQKRIWVFHLLSPRSQKCSRSSQFVRNSKGKPGDEICA